MAITAVQLLSVPVTDQDRARDFYVAILGFDLLRDAEMQPGLRWVQVAPPGAQTSLTLVTWFESMPAGTLRGLGLETERPRRRPECLHPRGALVADGIQDQPWGRYFTLADPDGNGLVVQETRARRANLTWHRRRRPPVEAAIGATLRLMLTSGRRAGRCTWYLSVVHQAPDDGRPGRCSGSGRGQRSRR